MDHSPESKSGKPKEHKYSASTAQDFLTKISETGLGEIVTGKTKKSIVFIVPKKRFLDDASLLFTDEEPKGKGKEGKVE